MQSKGWTLLLKSCVVGCRLHDAPVGGGVDKVQQAVDTPVNNGLAVQPRFILEILQEGVVQVLDKRLAAA